MEVPVRVVTRVRPQTTQENNHGTCIQVAPAASQVILGYDHFCDFDAVFGHDVPQKELYDSCLSDMVVNFFQGYNVTVIGYGQRGSGKTYTMTGPDFLWAMNEEEFGLLPQAVRHVFNLMRECPGREYRVHVSYLAVQRDAVYDLLSTSNSYMQLNVLEDNMGNVVIPGLNVIDCSNITEVINCLEAGLVHRHTAAIHSHDPSASHAIFSLILEHQWTDPDGKLKYLYSRMSFVDLGGSERLVQFGYGDYGRPGEESFFLNSDLKALGNVIHCLADQTYNGPIPYKESKLTHILKDAFGGNSLSLMVCCLSPSAEDFDASFNTLKYGGLARYILNFPAVNMAIQNSARGSTATMSPSSAHTTLPHQSGSRQSTLTGIQSSVQQSLGTVQQSTGTNDTSTVAALDDAGSLDTEDMFKFQFAASQWQLLVSSAEDLLSEILRSTQVSPTEKARIESWLCLKAEAEECIGMDLGPLRFNAATNRVLEVIEELSEPEANTTLESGTEMSHSDSDTSSMSSFGEEFYDQLAVLKGRFRSHTDDVVNKVQESHDTLANVRQSAERRKSELAKNQEDKAQSKNTSSRKSSRHSHKTAESILLTKGLQMAPRKTRENVNSSVERSSSVSSSITLAMMPEGRLSVISQVNSSVKSDEGVGVKSSIHSDIISDEEHEVPNPRRKSSLSCVSRFSQISKSSRRKSNSEKIGDDEEGSTSLVEEVKRLSASQDLRRGQIRRVSVELRAAQQRLKQLNATIRLKEAFIRELVRCGGEAEVTKRKCEAKMERLEKEIHRARQQYEEAQNQLKELREGESEDVGQYRSRVDSLKKQISHYQKKLLTLEKVSAISQQADTKVEELEGSVKEMRRQQEELQTRLRDELQRKEELEQQIIVDQRRIRALEIRLKQDEGESESDRGWLAEEEERILKLREATQQLQNEVKMREEAVKQREWMHKEKLRLETSRQDSEERRKGSGNEEALTERRESDLREEISHLRDARDSLMVRRQKLNRRIHKSHGHGVGSGEERRLLELDEAIEAVDAAIEYKNEVICGRAKELKSTAKLLSHDNLMERLMNLCPEETRSLLVKYFNKVIDLRIEFRKQEISFSDLETQYDEQQRYISDLKAAYQQASLEMERRITSQQRDYQQKISTLLRQFNDDSSGSGAQEFRLREMEQQLFYYKKLSRDLKAKLRQYSEDVRSERPKDPLPGPSSQPASGASTRPDHGAYMPRRRPLLPSRPPAPLLPKRTRMQAAEQAAKHPTPLTKVTREKNKIIIQQKSDRQGKAKGAAAESR
ncbi:kinesin-like protein KIF7 [Penaeus chinensis]|uniref:kinesin-like protein KIF7 n=1 Tax=Penaeus chinensis TaxID=139456 RepID=UPI001FB759C6|nr:kinesin-like protein KIF7 [Penaeus chinensis]